MSLSLRGLRGLCSSLVGSTFDALSRKWGEYLLGLQTTPSIYSLWVVSVLTDK